MPLTNLEIAQSSEILPISEIANKIGLDVDDFDNYGRFKAKLTQSGIEKLLARKSEKSKLILVSAMTPTPHGEGKTTMTIGLTQGLQAIGKSAISATREPALGPIFGVKGGAAGGGYSQVLPMEDINLFFTGDFPAIQTAHNLLSAAIDSHLHHGNASGLDVRRITWPRSIDMNDRALRKITIGLGGLNGGIPREDGFVIAPASEIMAILCLSRTIDDLKSRLESILVGSRHDGSPVLARDIEVTGAMAALLRDAIRPNLVQTIEHGPALIHGGPFGNIAHGCSSILATECGLGVAEYTITEAGFGSDLGAEKFLNLVTPILGRGPDAIVCVGTIRAIRHHGSGNLELGCENYLRHCQHLSQYGVPVVLALNRFYSDSDAELESVIGICQSAGYPTVIADPFGSGGKGCQELAFQVVLAASKNKGTFIGSLYPQDATIGERLNLIVQKVYGGKGAVLSESATKSLAWAKKYGFDRLPVCVAKTQYSLSDDPKLLNSPHDFDLHVLELKFSLGAGFVVAIAGDIMLMPGLGKDPAAFHIDLDASGRISGLF